MKKTFQIPNKQSVTETLALAELGARARIIFHDLSNHLTALSLSVGQLEENLARETAQLQEYARRGEKARQQMEYVANLLRSHIENASDTYFEPEVEIAHVAQNFSDKARASNIEIFVATQKDSTGGSKIFGSKHAFAHIVTNLLSNAIESFEPQSQARKQQHITITLRNHPKLFSFSVSDTGSGIPQSVLPYIFDSRYTTKDRGHGIGLLATKEFVEHTFRGKISVKTKLGNGTTFLVEIPLEPQNKKQQSTNYCASALNDRAMSVPSVVRGTSIL